MPLNSKQKSLISSYFPDLRGRLEGPHSAAFDSVAIALINKLESIKGEPGYTPVKGKDYFTDKEISDLIKNIKDSAIPEDILKKATPKKGIHYADGKDGRPGRDGKDGPRGPNGEMGLMGRPGKDGSPDSAVGIANKLNTLPAGTLKASLIEGVFTIEDHAKKERKVLEGMAIIDGRLKLIDQRWGGHGGGSGSRTVVVAGSHITITGTGTSGDPYVINSTAQAPISLTTTGTSGAATFSGNILNIPQYSGGGGGTQAYEGPLTITGTTTATVNFVPIWITVQGITLVENYGWTRSSQTVTFADVITGTTIINFHNGTAIPPPGGTTFEVPSGTVNGSNQSFIFATAPSVVVIDGTAYQKTSSDGTVNWTGTTSITTVRMPGSDIFGFDNSDSSFQQPSGTVNGSNQSFVFSTAPNVIVIDGTPVNKTSSDGTSNWSGTTSVTLVQPPTSDVFAFGGLADYQVPSGAVNNSNTSFTYVAAPNVIVEDGTIRRKTSADGTSNWSGTTSVTVVPIPSRNVFTP